MNANDLLKFLNAVAEEVKQNGRTLKDVTINFRRTDDSDVEVCDSIGVEYMYMRNPEKLSWW